MSSVDDVASPDPLPTRFPALDGLRGLAALAIVATHTGFASGASLHANLFGAILGRLDVGVAVFFALSGFLLFRPFVVNMFAGAARPRVLNFWWRRVLRVFPALWLAVAVALGVLSQRSSSPSEWWHYLTLIQVYDHHEVEPTLSQLWTLSAEIAFYAALPVLALVTHRHDGDSSTALRRTIGMIAALGVVALSFNIAQANLLSRTQSLLWMPAYLDWFAAGMSLAVLTAIPVDSPLLARTRTTAREWARSPGTCLALAVILWLFSTTQLGTPRTVTLPTFWQWTVQHYLFLAVAALVMTPLVLNTESVLNRLLGGRVGRLLGRLSYGVYLWHLALLTFLQRELGYGVFRGHFWELFAATTVASLAVAALSWYFVEKPILRYGSGLVRGRRSGRPPMAAKHAARTVSS